MASRRPNAKQASTRLSSKNFDATPRVVQSSLRFGATGSEQSLAFCSGAEDVNNDGLLDLVCHFSTPLTDFLLIRYGWQ